VIQFAYKSIRRCCEHRIQKNAYDWLRTPCNPNSQVSPPLHPPLVSTEPILAKFGLDAYGKRLLRFQRTNAITGIAISVDLATECLNVNVNFFEWLRDGVRQSVLLGVSDAIEQIGTPADSDEIHPGVAAFLQSDKTETKRVGAAPAPSSGGNRKRLGRSLKDIDQSAAATS
jgi:hypothetical protein